MSLHSFICHISPQRLTGHSLADYQGTGVVVLALVVLTILELWRRAQVPLAGLRFHEGLYFEDDAPSLPVVFSCALHTGF